MALVAPIRILADLAQVSEAGIPAILICFVEWTGVLCLPWVVSTNLPSVPIANPR